MKYDILESRPGRMRNLNKSYSIMDYEAIDNAMAIFVDKKKTKKRNSSREVKKREIIAMTLA